VIFQLQVLEFSRKNLGLSRRPGKPVSNCWLPTVERILVVRSPARAHYVVGGPAVVGCVVVYERLLSAVCLVRQLQSPPLHPHHPSPHQDHRHHWESSSGSRTGWAESDHPLTSAQCMSYDPI